MLLQQIVSIGWVVHLIACHYILRHIRHNVLRTILTLIPCLLLTYYGCYDLPPLQMSSLIMVSLYWIMSIRIVHLIIFSPDEPRTFYSFNGKLFWTLFPIIPSSSIEPQWPIICDFLLGSIKLIINHWIFRWLSYCGPSNSYTSMIMFYIMLLTGSHTLDILSGFVRLVTREQYTLLSMNNYPLLSTSLREFWGQRYNRLAGAVFKESIFTPIRSCLSSSMIAALITFIISGLLHVHVVAVTFPDPQFILPTFSFFLLHGIACSIETYLTIRIPEPLGWFITHFFLLITAPLVMGSYTQQGRQYFADNPPPLFDAQWIPKIQVPRVCP